jgi:hypothetical protein
MSSNDAYEAVESYEWRRGMQKRHFYRETPLHRKTHTSESIVA